MFEGSMVTRDTHLSLDAAALDIISDTHTKLS